MKRLLMLVLALILCTGSLAFAEGMYVSGSAGVTMLSDANAYQVYYGKEKIKYDTGIGWNVAIGQELGIARVEAELGYKYASMDTFTHSGITEKSSTDQYLLSGMINGYLDLKNSTPVTPYIGAGAGMIYGQVDFGNYTIDDVKFGYQLIAGAGYKINKNLIFDLSYRYQAISGNFSSGREYLEYASNSAFAGLRYRF